MTRKYDTQGKGVLYPVGVMRMLKNLRRLSNPDTTIVISEYFTRKGGGSIQKLPGHNEFRLNLDFVCELVRDAGFSVDVEPLIDFLNMDFSAAPANRGILHFGKFYLDLPISATIPISERQLSREFGCVSNRVPKTFLSRADWLRLLADYSVLILRPLLKCSPEILRCTRFKKCPNVFATNSPHKGPILIQSYPVRGLPLSPLEAFVWSQIDGRRNASDLAARVAASFHVSLSRGERMTLRFLRTLIAGHYVRY